MKLLSLVLIFSLLSGVASAQDEAEEKVVEPQVDEEISQKYELGKIFQSNKNIELPQEVISYIEAKYLEDVKRQDEVRAGSMSDAELIVKFRRQILDVSVLFKNINDFFEKPIFFDLNQGGGGIDLHQYLGTKPPGKFNLRIIAKKPEDVPSLEEFQKHFRVIFISNSKKRDGGSVPWGVGCDKFLDITGYFKSSIMNEKGIILSTVDDQHVSALAGRFLIFYTQQNDVFMSLVSFYDRSKPDLQCTMN
ncbi:MAG: hypothetical protein R2827_16580 [Bdellovibrionales bacterium]